MKATQDIYIGNGEYIPAGADIADFADKLDKEDMKRLKELGVIADADAQSKSFGIATDGKESMVKQGDPLGKQEDGNLGTVESYGELTVKELVEVCKEYGLEIPKGSKKPEIIALIEAHETGLDAKGNDAQ